MDTKHLRYYLEIIDCGSISKAASELGVAQPSLSQMLLRLEDIAGAKLLNRSTSGVTPTYAGKMFADHARTILKQTQLALESVREATNHVAGRVVLGVPTSTSMVMGAPLVQRAARDLRDVSLCITEAKSWHLLEWLEANDIDLSIQYNPKPSNHLVIRPLLTEELCLVGPCGAFGPVDQNGVALERVAFENLNEFKLIMPTMPHASRQFVQTAASSRGVHLDVATEIDALTLIKLLVVDGSGFALLSEAGVRPELRAGKLNAARIANPPLRRSVHLVRNATKPRTAAMIAVENVLVLLVRELVEGGQWSGTLEAAEA